VRVRHIAETRDPESFAEDPAWTANYRATKDLPEASGDDIVWADAVIFGSPTRFGSVTSQFRTFIDSLGGLWSEGKLADKVYAAFTSSQTLHGGQESTILTLYVTLMHFGGIIVPPGYTDQVKYVDGNPHGVGLIAKPRQHGDTRRRDERGTRPPCAPGARRGRSAQPLVGVRRRAQGAGRRCSVRAGLISAIRGNTGTWPRRSDGGPARRGMRRS
jgi:NAD(P)H dehydrogenase (quinone)